MENKINIAKLLKDCPVGMELDCTMFDNVTFIDVEGDDKPICIRTGDIYRYLTKFGTWTFDENAKCVIFPKGKTTWVGFHIPFKDGDIAISESGDIHLLKTSNSSYCAYRESWKILPKFDSTITTNVTIVRLATEEEKTKLFNAIKANGYKWNAETKTLEELVESNEDVDDRVVMSGIYFDRENYADEVELHLGNYDIEIRDGKTYAVFKNQKTETLKPKFNDGDIIYIKSKSDLNLELVGIYKKEDNELIYDYCSVSLNSQSFYHHNVHGLISKNNIDISRLATECEKRKLFDAINENGYKWNDETKTLDAWIKPKFKVGDRLKTKTSKDFYTITEIRDNDYLMSYGNDYYSYPVSFCKEGNYELVPNKFDITTLVPFESKVLMRSSNAREWVGTIYSHYNNNYFFGCGMMCQQCIPYEGNEHLLGKTDDCNDFYKTW